MNSNLIKVFSKLLRDTADKLDAGTCEISEDQAYDVMQMLSHTPLTKDQACTYLNLSRSRFDDLVRQGIIPRGKKTRGHRELSWWQDEINIALKNYKDENI